MKTKFEINDMEDAADTVATFVYTISEITKTGTGKNQNRKQIYFEVHISGTTKNSNTKFVKEFPIDDITLASDFGDITIYFGDFGHIHLGEELAKKICTGITKLIQETTRIDEI